VGDVSKTYKGVRDWGVKARRAGDKVVVTVKIGTYVHSRVDLSVATWPTNLYDQRQAATKALAGAISLSADEWDSGELDRIPDEIVKAMNEVTEVQR
jgi:hypothetical protein